MLDEADTRLARGGDDEREDGRGAGSAKTLITWLGPGQATMQLHGGMSTFLSSCGEGRRSWCRCKVRWLSTRLSSCREGSKSRCRCNGRWKSNLCSNSRQASRSWCKCKGRWVNICRSLSSWDEGRRETERLHGGYRGWGGGREERLHSGYRGWGGREEQLHSDSRVADISSLKWQLYSCFGEK